MYTKCFGIPIVPTKKAELITLLRIALPTIINIAREVRPLLLHKGCYTFLSALP